MALSERARKKVKEVRHEDVVRQAMSLTPVGNRGVRITLMAEALEAESVDRDDPSDAEQIYLPDLGLIVIDLNNE